MQQYDLIVIGAGSGNMVIDDSFAHLSVAIVEQGPFGGTCLNVGCIPSKMLSYTAETADRVRESERYDIDAELRRVRWQDVRERVFGRLDEAARSGQQGREDSEFVTVYSGTARFTGPRELRIDLPDGPVDIGADRIVIAAGSRPVIPPPVRDSVLPYETSDSIMRIDSPPKRLAVLGGGYIAAELAQVFAAIGSAVTIVEKAPGLLGPQDELVTREFTELARSRFDVHLERELTELGGEPGALRLTLDDGTVLEADTLLVAVGRVPNGDRLDLEKAGIDTHEDGRIVVDRYQRTTVDGVFALGDVCSPVPLKHVANREAQVVAHNLRNPGDLISAEHDLVPAAVFTQPQIASAGRTEGACREEGLDYTVGLARYADVAYGWAMEDETGFCKVLAERGTGRLLGAHLMGPQASTLIHPLALAMAQGMSVDTLITSTYWIHPALTEVVENALRDLNC